MDIFVDHVLEITKVTSWMCWGTTVQHQIECFLWIIPMLSCVIKPPLYRDIPRACPLMRISSYVLSDFVV